jgi:hypothetical protein
LDPRVATAPRIRLQPVEVPTEAAGVDVRARPARDPVDAAATQQLSPPAPETAAAAAPVRTEPVAPVVIESIRVEVAGPAGPAPDPFAGLRHHLGGITRWGRR